jgi:hypothetical protein
MPHPFRRIGTLLAFLAWILPALSAVVVNEIHYHPVELAAFDADGNPVMDLSEDVHEFVEFHNPDPVAQDLGGWTLSGAVDFVFPIGTSIPPGGYLVVAGNPDRLADVAAYGLRRADLRGPWTGKLGNSGDTVRLRDPSGQVRDSVGYAPISPWPITADALGVDSDWSGIAPGPHQYRGRSLERVRPDLPSSDPGNWIASPLSAGPSPGRPNRVGQTPLPVVLVSSVSQATDGHRLIRAQNPVAIEVVLSRLPEGAVPVVEAFKDDLNVTNESVMRRPMQRIGSAAENRYTAELPGQTNRSLVRWRIALETSTSNQVVSPRPDDPFGWHAYFVTPSRAATTNGIYDVLISTRSLTILTTNIASTPRRWMGLNPPAALRPSWNASQPAVFVFDGHVYDVMFRHHGSQFRRDVNRRSYKVQFPAYDRLDGRESLFVTDKDYRTAGGHAIWRAADLPTSRTWWVDLYLNNNTRLQRLAQEEYDSDLLRRYHAEHDAAAPAGTPRELPGELLKIQGVFDQEGPFGRGDGSRLTDLVRTGRVYWPARSRYGIIYSLQNRSWVGQTPFMQMLDAMWLARSNVTTIPRGVSTNRLAAFFRERWDLPKTFTHQAMINWGGVWDDTVHNYFLWRQRDGRWAWLPWDFDDMFDARGTGDSIFDGAPFGGVNYFRQGLMSSVRADYAAKAWEVNNTLLDPENLAQLGVSANITRWAAGRQSSVNRQLGLGNYPRPQRPVALAPGGLAGVGPGTLLRAGPYANTNAGAGPLAASHWQIRATNGNWFEPLVSVTNAGPATSFPIPFDRLAIGTSYQWRVRFLDPAGRPSVWSTNQLFRYGPPASSAWRISEFLAENRGSVRNGQDLPDFVELAPDGLPTNLSGWTLTDDLANPAKFVFASNPIPGAGGRVVVWCDRRTGSPGLHSGFALDNDGETLALFRPGTNGLELADLVVFGPQLADTSVGRVGTGWRPGAPSPGSVNLEVELGPNRGVRINEWLAGSSGTASDWIELHNASSSVVELTGLSLTDDLGVPAKSPFPPLSYIAPNGFLRVVADGAANPTGNRATFRLSSGGSALGLFDGAGRRIDHVLFGPQPSGTAMGRIPDGTGDLQPLGAGSPGASNPVPDLDRDGMADAWESAQGLLGLGASGAPGADPDTDGLTNIQEFRLGTDPLDASSDFHLQVIVEGAEPLVEFHAAPRQRYLLQRLVPGSGTWLDDTEFRKGDLPRRVRHPIGGDAAGIFRVRIAD